MSPSITSPHGTLATDNRQQLHHTNRPLRHAVVIGAGMGGLLAANALARHAATVTMLERDVLSTDFAPRKGVPQGQHVHALLARGLSTIEAAVPGFTADLVALGANAGDASNNAIWFQDGARHLQTTTGETAVVATRALFEGVLRQRVGALPNVTIRDRTAVRNLCWNAERTRVTGVRLAERGDDSFTLCHEPADLVIDASGRGSQLATWLADAGFPAAPVTEIPSGVRYTSRTFARRDTSIPERIALICVAGPDSRRGGIAFAIEGARWLVTLIGRENDNPPLDLDGFRAFARSLPLPDIAAVIEGAAPLDEGHRYHTPVSTRHHVERLARFPSGLLPFGDAICTLPPVYGQGMSVAALEATTLDICLATGTDRLFERFTRDITPILDNAWDLACGGELPLLFPPEQLPRKVRFLQRYLHLLHQAARSDHQVAAAFTNVVHLNAPAASLAAPRIACRVIAAQFGRPNKRGEVSVTPAVPQPTHASRAR